MNARSLLLFFSVLLLASRASGGVLYQDALFGVQKTSDLIYGTGLAPARST